MKSVHLHCQYPPDQLLWSSILARDRSAAKRVYLFLILILILILKLLSEFLYEISIKAKKTSTKNIGK